MNTIFKIAILLFAFLTYSIATANETSALTKHLKLSFAGQSAPLELKQFINSILAKHPRLLQERAREEIARANLRAADQALYNPEIEIDSEKTDITTSTLQLSQTIDIGGKRNARTDVAQSELVQAEAEFELASQQLVYDVLVALAQHYTNIETYSLVQHNLELMKDFATISTQRHQAGDLSQVELNLARLAYSEASINQTHAANDRITSTENLRALLGKLPSSYPELPTTLPTAQFPEDQDKFLLTLPAVRIEQAKVNNARKTVAFRQSEKSWDPTISIRSGTEDKQNLTGITLSIPLNIRNSFSAEVQAAQQQLIQSEYQALQQYRDQRAIIAISTQRYTVVQESWRNWSQTGDTSIQDQLKLIKRLWQIGDLNTTDYLVQLKQTIETQLAGLELRGKFWKSAFKWMNTTASITQWLNINVNKLETSK